MYKDVFGRYAPPADWVPKYGAPERFDTAEQWPLLVQRGLRFPESDGPPELCTTNGGCLAPLIPDGRTIVRMRPVSPDEPLIDSGLYIFECDWKEPETAAAYCTERRGIMGPKNVVMKFLRYAAYEWWYVCNQGIGELRKVAGLNILARVVGIEQVRVNNDTGQIGSNAATDITAVSVPSTTLGVIAGALATIAVAAKPTAYTATVTASANVWQATSGGAFVFLAQIIGGVPSGTTSQPVPVLSGASPGENVSTVFSFPVAVNTAMTFALWYNSGTLANNGRGTNIDLRVDVVKR